MKHTLPMLDYPYNALEPFIDEKTMFIHHTKHHQTYIDSLNMVLERYPEYKNANLDELMTKINEINMTEKDKILFRNHGGGHLNHSFFWNIMAPKKNVDNKLVERIIRQWNSIEDFKEKFKNIAISHFGSGWAWVVEDNNKNLLMYSTPNQDSPLMQGHKPIIGLDVWEHAYYLKYQNKRSEYIDNWWNVLKII